MRSHVRREVRDAAGLSVLLTAAVLAVGALAAGLMGFSDWAPSWIGSAREPRTVELHPAEPVLGAAPAAKRPAPRHASAPAAAAVARATAPAGARQHATSAPHARKHARRGSAQRRAVAAPPAPAVAPTAPAQPVVTAAVPAAKPRLRTASASTPVPVAHNNIHPVKPGKGPAKQAPGHAKPVSPGHARKPAAVPAPTPLAAPAAPPAAPALVHGPPPGHGREHAPGQLKKH